MAKKAVVVGAGIGGLTSAALLLHSGYDVTVLEAEAYGGGSAGTFYYQKYRFDVGATLAGGFGFGQPHARLGEMLGIDWPVRPVDPAWVVHLSQMSVTHWADPDRWREERQLAFPGTESFWRRQEMLAEIAWDVSTRYFPWPPARLRDVYWLGRAVRPRTLLAAPYFFQKITDLAPARISPDFEAFLDAQLIISAQTTARRASALYGSAALDLPRRGVYQVDGGIGGLAKTLAQWISAHGGKVMYHQRVEKIKINQEKALAAITNKGLEVEGDLFVANMPPQSLSKLLHSGRTIHSFPSTKPGWGAFVLYLGVESGSLPANLADHHQVIMNPAAPPGEGNTVFISISNRDDPARAPQGMRAMTISTHTSAKPWWQLLQSDPEAYERRKEQYTELLLYAAERVIPRVRAAIKVCLPGTPVTYERFTHRHLGLVGGFPQTSLFAGGAPATQIPNLKIVGDSIFPGQSTAGVTLGAMRLVLDIIS